MHLNGRQRQRYIIMCASIDTLEEFCAEKTFKCFEPKTKMIIRTALTNMKKMREEVPREVDVKSCKALLNDIKDYKLQLTYTGSQRYNVSSKEIDDLMSYAIMGMCKGCEKDEKAVERCQFKKQWSHAMVESDFDVRSCSCEYSFKPYD